MKKIVSMLMVLFILVNGFSVVSLSTNAHEEKNQEVEIQFETAPVTLFEEETVCVETEATELPSAVEAELPEATENIMEMTVENTSTHEEQNLESLPMLLDDYEVSIVNYVYEGCNKKITEDAFIFTMSEMYRQCLEIDETVKICIVEHEGSFYLVTEWEHGGRGYTPVCKVIYEDGEEFFYSYGEDFRRMTRVAYVCGDEMY